MSPLLDDAISHPWHPPVDDAISHPLDDAISHPCCEVIMFALMDHFYPAPVIPQPDAGPMPISAIALPSGTTCPSIRGKEL